MELVSARKTAIEIFTERVGLNEVHETTLSSINHFHNLPLFLKDTKIISTAAYFIGPQFSENCILETCYFENGLLATRQDFNKYLSFKNSVFAQGFFGTLIRADQKVEFSNVLIENRTQFWECHFKSSITFEKAIFRGEIEFERCTFHAYLSFKEASFHDLATFLNCTFYGQVSFADTQFSNHIFFKNCTFKQAVDLSSKLAPLVIPQLTIHHTTFGEEVVFYSRTFQEANFHAVTFNGVADFYDTCFEQPVNFAKTKFLDTCSFVKARFERIAVFNLAVIGRNMVLRDACFEQGVNLATIDFVGEGTINSFGVNIRPFTADKDAQDINLGDNWKKISQQHLRETYRILKHESIKQNNKIQALEYHAEEMDSFLSELRNKGLKWYENDRFVTEFNRLSNYYGLSWRRGLGWLLSISILGFILYWISLSTSRPVVFSLDTTLMETVKSVGKVISYYLQFTNPAHDIGFMEEHAGSWSYVLDIFVRLLVGLVIYQTIQAFRKYGRF